MAPMTDPADKGTDQFKPVSNRRAGYSPENFSRILKCARAGGTLQAGEGLQIIEHFEDLLFSYLSDDKCRRGCEIQKVTKEFCLCWKDVRNLSPA
jgi:hypothetical protein